MKSVLRNCRALCYPRVKERLRNYCSDLLFFRYWVIVYSMQPQKELHRRLWISLSAPSASSIYRIPKGKLITAHVRMLRTKITLARLPLTSNGWSVNKPASSLDSCSPAAQMVMVLAFSLPPRSSSTYLL